MLQVHDQEDTRHSEIVKIDIADNSAISAKVRLVNFAVSRAARVQFSSIPGISFRITKRSLIHPSSSRRRRVEDLWVLIGRYFTMARFVNLRVV